MSYCVQKRRLIQHLIVINIGCSGGRGRLVCGMNCFQSKRSLNVRTSELILSSRKLLKLNNVTS